MKNIYLTKYGKKQDNGDTTFTGYACKNGKCLTGEIVFQEGVLPTIFNIFGRFGELTKSNALNDDDFSNELIPLMDEEDLLKNLNTNVMAILNFKEDVKEEAL